ncbi:SRPBCC family protein [Nonomuraea gerenzanensis]|uniref:Carbon monoxide oxidation accessory protein CoxG n=1 Tax=Nonomuraea gerenzanensis TaxID=93944 RepID=A0A1M4E024_9ACTN|nr:SRPBCC family protein [Nonomuraea gerenzanensis]UBU14443.1 SRPBCC family protein [Nonomuraea gerenzanensis]SBO92158.1 Carbon monoxide oxidation accessory protein CoxG [Nonomuraea gerenzanensis]
MAMRFEHEFTVPVPVEQAWAVLLDVERVAPCLPGATLDIFEGDEFTGRMKVKVGPITVTYRGTARFEDVDKDSYSLTIQASGKEARGSGTASATVRARMEPREEATLVTVETSFNVTGRPAQFGRGVMAEVGGRLIEKFAANLAELLSEPAVEQVAPTQERQEEERHLSAVPEQDFHPAGTLRTSRSPDEEALDLLEIAGQPLLKRLAPIVGGIAALIVVIWVIRRLMR